MIDHFSAESANRLAASWADLMWAVSWQFCVLGVIVWIANCSLYKAAPNWRYWLWQILAVKLLLMPFWTMAVPWGGLVRDLSALSTRSMATQPAPQASEQLVAGVKSPSRLNVENQPPTVASNSVDRPPLRHDVLPIAATQQPSQHVARSVSEPPDRLAVMAAKPHRTKPAVNEHSSNPNTPSSAARTSPLITHPPTASAIQRRIPASTTAQEAVKPPTAAPAFVVNSSRSENSARTTGLSGQAWLMLAWFGGISWCAMRVWRQGRSLKRRLTETAPADAGLLQRVRSAAARLEVNHIPRVSVVDLDVSPFVCGLWKTHLIVPRSLAEAFTSEQIDLVLLHELAHIRRGDLIWGWIPEVAKALFFFHPMVHVLSYQIRFERELACDQLAILASGRDVATYADTLVRVVGQFSSPDAFRLTAVESPIV